MALIISWLIAIDMAMGLHCATLVVHPLSISGSGFVNDGRTVRYHSKTFPACHYLMSKTDNGP